MIFALHLSILEDLKSKLLCEIDLSIRFVFVLEIDPQGAQKIPIADPLLFWSRFEYVDEV